MIQMSSIEAFYKQQSLERKPEIHNAFFAVVVCHSKSLSSRKVAKQTINLSMAGMLKCCTIEIKYGVSESIEPKMLWQKENTSRLSGCYLQVCVGSRAKEVCRGYS